MAGRSANKGLQKSKVDFKANTTQLHQKNENGGLEAAEIQKRKLANKN